MTATEELICDLKLWACSPRVPEKVQLLILEAIGRLSAPTEVAPMTAWLRENAPDCGDNSCLFGGRGKGGMRTNGGCRCFKDLPTAKRIYVERLFASQAEPQPPLHTEEK